MFFNRLSRPMMAILALASGLCQTVAAQDLTVSPFQLGIYFQRNTPSGNAVSRALEVTNITTRVVVTTTIDGPANVNWLFINPTVLNANEGATRRVDVTLLLGALPVGTYTGTVRFTPDGGIALVVPVTVTVGDNRGQNVVPSTLDFVLQRGSPRTSPIPINVTSTFGVLAFTTVALASPVPWILVDSGPTNTPGSISVSLLAGDLTPGAYSGTITATAVGMVGETIGNPTLVVPVRLRVVDDSKLSVVPATLGFDYQLGGPVPAARAVAVTSSGSPLSFTGEVVTPGTNIQWLVVTPLLGNTPQNVSIGLQNLASLPAGVFTGTITFKSPNSPNQVVTVTLRVATDPLLTVSPPGQLTFTFQQGGPQPPRQTVIASNFGNPASITATALGVASQWLTISTPAATTPAALVIGVNTTNLSPGVFDGNVEIRGNFGNSPLLVPVRLVVAANTQPLLRVSQNLINFAFQTGGATTTLSQTVNVSSTGAQLQFAATGSGGAGWLGVTPQGNQATPGNVTVSVTPGSLPPNVYNAQVIVQTPEQGAVPIIIPVRMVISTQPLLSVTPSSLAFTSTGATTTLRQTITVGSTGSSFAYQSSSSIAGGGTWLVIAQSGPNTGSTVEVGVNPVVAEGAGLVTITAPGIENSPVFVPVTLSNTGPTSQLTITPGSLDFVQVIGGTPAAAQTLDITLGQAAGLTSFRIGDIRYLNGSGWLKVSKTAGIAPDKVDVSVDASGLLASCPLTSISCRYAATIPFESTVGNRDILVFLEVRRVAGSFTANPESLTFAFTTGGPVPVSQQLQIASTGEAFPFTVEARVPAGTSAWLQVAASSATTPALLTVSVNPALLAGGTYQGTINLTGAGGAVTRVINVTLNVAAVATPVITRMVNAASFVDSAAVPGLIVSFVGTGLGPVAGVAAAPNGSGLFDRQLGNVKVIFDTFEAPILFVSSTQVNAIVPYSLATRISTRVQVEVNGVRSNAIELRVVPASPAIFLLNAAGQGAILNQDSTVNGAGNPAARDSVIVIYATGEGQTSPQGLDGTIPGRSTALKTPLLRVRVRIGGQEAEVQYAGSAPFLVSGAMQINAKVPAGVLPGPAVPIEVIVGDAASPAGVTVSVR